MPRWLVLTCMWLVSSGALAYVAAYIHRTELHLGEPVRVSGYTLLGVVLLLAAFNIRKRIPALPVIRATWWTYAHAIGGVLALGLFWLHIGGGWAQGSYEQWLAGLYYLVIVSGIIGYVIQRIYPSRITQTGMEIIFERVPSEIADMRDQAEAIVVSCSEKTGADTLARHYLETLSWFFLKPRFVLNHLFGGRRGVHWVWQQCEAVQPYLNEEEQVYLRQLRNLAGRKVRIDYQYAAQGLMKLWLLVHVPATAAMLVLMAWHFLVVNIYAL